MLDRQENKLTMFEAVISLLDANTAKTAVVAAFAATYNMFKNFVTEIKAKDVEKSGATTGKTSTKNADKEALISAVMLVGSAISALGAATNNNQLKEGGKVTRSELNDIRDTLLVTKAQGVHDLTNGNAAALAPYGITVAVITDLNTKITNYNNSLGARESSVAQQVGATTQVKSLFKKADKQLTEQIDLIMESFAGSDPQFYDEYKQARVIYDLGGGGSNPPPPTPPTP